MSAATTHMTSHTNHINSTIDNKTIENTAAYSWEKISHIRCGGRSGIIIIIIMHLLQTIPLRKM